MILTVRYPHVRELVLHYAKIFSDMTVLSIMDTGLRSEGEAEHFSVFVWRMLDEMAKDREENNMVLGGIDNTSMGPDIAYEVGVFMEESGYGLIWEKVSEES